MLSTVSVGTRVSTTFSKKSVSSPSFLRYYATTQVQTSTPNSHSDPISTTLPTTSSNSTSFVLPPQTKRAIIESVYGPAEPKYKHRFKNRPTSSVYKTKLLGARRAIRLIQALEEAKKKASEGELITVNLKKLSQEEQHKLKVKVLSYIPTTKTEGVPENATVVPSSTETSSSSTTATTTSSKASKIKKVDPKVTVESSNTIMSKETKDSEMVDPSTLIPSESALTSITSTMQLWASSFVRLFMDTRLSVYLLVKNGMNVTNNTVHDMLHLQKNRRDWGKLLLASIGIYFYHPTILFLPALVYVQPTWLPSMFISHKRKMKLEVHRAKMRSSLAPKILKTFEKRVLQSTASVNALNGQPSHQLIALQNILVNKTQASRIPTYADVAHVTSYLAHHFTLGHLTYSEARNVARFFTLSLPFLFPRSRLLSRFSAVAHEDSLIRKERQPLDSSDFIDLCASRQLPYQVNPNLMKKAFHDHALFTAKLTTPSTAMAWVLARVLGCQKYYED